MKLKIYFFLGLLVILNACSNAQTDGTTKLTKKIDEYLRTYEETGFSGAILVAEKGKVTLRKGYGYANDSTWAKVTPQTIWTIGSITKPFTAAAILKLEMMGKLSTEDPLEKHIEGLEDHIAKLTIHQLLTHTSGLVEYSGYDAESLNTEGLLEVVNNSRLKFSPGDEFAYSNTGYSMLGVIIEKVSGQPYEAFLQEQIFGPAGMSNTGYNLPNWNKEDFAVGYGSRGMWGTVYENNSYESGVSWNLKANGGILSTPEDMYKWYLALQGESIFPAAVKEKMFGQYIQTPGDFSPFNDKSPGYYGYGWGMTESAAFKPIIMHGGSNDVFEAGYMSYPEDEVFYFIASNRPAKSAVPAILAIDKIVSKKKYKMPQADVIPDSTITKNFKGEYAFEDGSRFTIDASTSSVGSLIVRPMDKESYIKIVGDKVEEKTEENISNFILEVVDKGSRNETYPTSLNFSSKKSKNDRDEDVDVSYGEDSNSSVTDLLDKFWKENTTEKGSFKGSDLWGVVQLGDRYWVLVKVQFENGHSFIDFIVGVDDGEIKRLSSNHRPYALRLKPQSTFKFKEVNSGGEYEFTLNKSSGNVRIKSKLKGEKLTAVKTSANES